MYLPSSTSRKEFETETPKVSSQVFKKVSEKLIVSGSKYEAHFRNSIVKMQSLISHLRSNPETRPTYLKYILTAGDNLDKDLRNLIQVGATIEAICHSIREDLAGSIEWSGKLDAVFGIETDNEKNDSRTRDIEERVDTLETRINKLVDNEEIDKNVAVLFLSRFARGVRSIADTAYQAITENPEVISDKLLEEQNDEFKRKLNNLVETDTEGKVEYDDKKRTYYFNKLEDNETPPCFRVYISPRLSSNPSGVVQILENTLKATNCDGIHFKIFETLGRRHDQIIFYLREDELERFEKALEEFRKECPEDYLAEENLPTGIAIAPGISFGVEPMEFTQIAGLAGRTSVDSFSYNQLIALTTTIAYSFAYYDIFGDENNSDYQFEDLQEGASKYFEQILKIVGIKPETMMLQDVNDGNIPAWIQPHAAS